MQHKIRMSRLFVANDNSASDVWRTLCCWIQGNFAQYRR